MRERVACGPASVTDGILARAGFKLEANGFPLELRLKTAPECARIRRILDGRLQVKRARRSPQYPDLHRCTSFPAHIVPCDAGARLPTTGMSVVWYSPDVRGIVREESDAQYTEHNENAAEVYTQHMLLELTAFTPGQPSE